MFGVEELFLCYRFSLWRTFCLRISSENFHFTMAYIMKLMGRQRN